MLVAEISRLSEAMAIAKTCGDKARFKLLRRQRVAKRLELRQWKTLLSESGDIDVDDVDDVDDVESPDWRPATQSEVIVLIDLHQKFKDSQENTGASRRTTKTQSGDGFGNIADNRAAGQSNKEDLGYSFCATAVFNDRCRDLVFEKRDVDGVREFRRVYSPKKMALASFDDDKAEAGGYRILPSLVLQLGKVDRLGFITLTIARPADDCSRDEKQSYRAQCVALGTTPILGAIHARIGTESFTNSGNICFWTGCECYYPPMSGGIFLNKKSLLKGFKEVSRQEGTDLQDAERYQQLLRNVAEVRIETLLQSKDLTPAAYQLCDELFDKMQDMQR